MIVTTYLTNNINGNGGLFTDIWGHYVTPAQTCFNYGDVIQFKWIRGPFGAHRYDMAFNGWFVFDMCDSYLHKTRYPMTFAEGSQWTPHMKLRMDYGGNIILVAEVT